MDYEIEFERLLDYARQALSGVSVEKREVIGFAGLAILADVVSDYENRLTQLFVGALDGCSYSPDKIHHFDGGSAAAAHLIVGRLPYSQKRNP